MTPQHQTYLLLLRGINVGGRNVIKMADLAACLKKHGLEDVQTYIQSGNVLFRSDKVKTRLVRELEQLLSKRFGYTATIVVVSETELRAVISKAPRGFGKRPDEYYSDVLFLMPPLKPAEVKPQLKLRDGVDRVWTGNGVVYFARLGSERTRSKLGEITKLPVYQRLTIRSWKTTVTLLEKLDALGD